MAVVSLSIQPTLTQLAPHEAPQLSYLLLSLTPSGQQGSRSVNWALLADASRSMRIPIVGEAQFRELVRRGGAQETLVDGVPVWQLSGPVPPEIKATAPSALDHVARALHSIVERLDAADRFALVACADEALLLVPSTPGDGRVALVQGISRLKSLRLGEETDLARGLQLALGQLRSGRNGTRVDRLVLLTDGFTRDPQACEQLAREMAAEGVVLSTLGLGGEFEEQLLTRLADLTGGRALFVRRLDDVPAAVDRELGVARAVAARAVLLNLDCAPGVSLRRATRIRPLLAPLQASASATAAQIWLGDLQHGQEQQVLLELLVPAHTRGRLRMGELQILSESSLLARAELLAEVGLAAGLPQTVHDAAARASVVQLQQRAVRAAPTDPHEAARLYRATAQRLLALGEAGLARAAEEAALQLESGGKLSGLTTKEITYATRRLGGE